MKIMLFGFFMAIGWHSASTIMMMLNHTVEQRLYKRKMKNVK